MAIVYKINVLDALKKAGYTSYKLREEKLLYEPNMQQLRRGILVSWSVIDRICKLLNCQPGDIMEYVP